MECPHCGAENDGFLPTCSECGKGLLARRESPDPVQPQPAASQPSFAPAPRERAPLDTSWAVGAHLAAFATFVFPLFGNIIGPWVIWLLRRNDDPFAEHHAREAINFNISITIYMVASAIAGLILLLVVIGILVLLLVLPALFLIWLILTIVASTRASAGEYYQYPITIRLVRGPRA